jgi:hypothetical protein
VKGHEDLKEEEGERGADWELSCPGCLRMKVQSEWRGMHDGTSHGKMKKALRDEGSARRRREPRVDYFLCSVFFNGRGWSDGSCIKVGYSGYSRRLVDWKEI